MHAILPAFALSLYLTDGVVDWWGADNDADGDNGNGGGEEGCVTQGLLLLALGRYSVQVN